MADEFGLPKPLELEPVDLNKTTAAEFLLFTSRPYKAFLAGGLEAEAPAAALALVPEDPNLPEAGVSGRVVPRGEKTVSLTVGSDPLRYSREATKLPKDQGTVVSDTIESSLGPIRSFVKETTNEADADFRGRTMGGSLNLGPLQFRGERTTGRRTVVPEEYRQFFRNPDVDEKTTEVGVGGSLPLGQGTLSGDLLRRFRSTELPQNIYQEARPTAQEPNVTGLNLGYEGQFGPGQLGVQGGLENVRGVGTGTRADMSYNVDKLFGLPVPTKVTGGYRNPVGGESSTEVMLRFGLPFGGPRR